MPDERAVNWVRETFAEDIIKLRENGKEVEHIQTLPFVEYMALNLLVEYYCGTNNVAKAPIGCGLRGTTPLDSIGELYEEAILDDSLPSVPDKLRRMIELDESSEDEGRKKSFYFKYFLDKLTNPEFVDYRALFHRLDSEYRAGSDYKAGLKRIYKEYENFKLIIELRGAKKKLESEEPVRKYVWNPIIKKMESEVESTKEAG